MQYGTQVNLASVDPNNCLENTTMPKSLKEQLLHLSEKLNAQGACSIENIFDQILDSQIIDVFNILSKPNAVTRLVTFLDEYPASLGERRKSKVELASVIADLDKRL
jgi:hypothetical protein